MENDVSLTLNKTCFIHAKRMTIAFEVKKEYEIIKVESRNSEF